LSDKAESESAKSSQLPVVDYQTCEINQNFFSKLDQVYFFGLRSAIKVVRFFDCAKNIRHKTLFLF